MLRSLLRRAPRTAPVHSEDNAILREVRRGGARVESLVLTRNRRVMASLGDRGRTLRLHESFRSAPRHVLVAVGVLVWSRSRVAREQAKVEIRRFIEVAVPPIRSRSNRSRPAGSPAATDLPHLSRLQDEFRRVNRQYFGNRLPTIPI